MRCTPGNRRSDVHSTIFFSPLLRFEFSSQFLNQHTEDLSSYPSRAHHKYQFASRSSSVSSLSASFLYSRVNIFPCHLKTRPVIHLTPCKTRSIPEDKGFSKVNNILLIIRAWWMLTQCIFSRAMYWQVKMPLSDHSQLSSLALCIACLQYIVIHYKQIFDLPRPPTPIFWNVQ